MKNDKLDLIINDQRRALSEEYVNYHLYKSTCYDEARMLVAANKGYLLIESVPSQEEKLLCLLE